MRPMMILGILFVAAGLYVVVNGASFTKDKTVFKAGPFEANVEKKQDIPPWVGALAIVAGVGLVVAGVRKR